MKYIFIFIIKFYQKVISPLKSFPSCRFYPSCSEYAIISIRRFGIIRGSYLSAKRILKCNPFCDGGVDIPPIKFKF